MTKITKLDAVTQVLAQFPEIAEWYATEHGVQADDLTEESVHLYGTGGHGDITDAILSEPEAEAICDAYEAQ